MLKEMKYLAGENELTSESEISFWGRILRDAQNDNHVILLYSLGFQVGR